MCLVRHTCSDDTLLDYGPFYYFFRICVVKHCSLPLLLHAFTVLWNIMLSAFGLCLVTIIDATKTIISVAKKVRAKPKAFLAQQTHPLRYSVAATCVTNLAFYSNRVMRGISVTINFLRVITYCRPIERDDYCTTQQVNTREWRTNHAVKLRHRTCIRLRKNPLKTTVQWLSNRLIRIVYYCSSLQHFI